MAAPEPRWHQRQLTGHRKYGLVLKKKDPKESSVLKPTSIFGDSSDEEQDPTKAKASATNLSATQIRHKKATALAHEKALAEDPTAFQYDEVYGDIVASREAKISAQKEADKERKPKYVHNLLKAAQKRELEHVAREERQQAREREAEAGQFADKEVFVTGAYRKQMEEVEKYKEEIARRDAIDNAQDVMKQANIGGFYKHLLNDLARVPGTMELKQEPPDDDADEQADQSQSSQSKTPKDKSEKKKAAYRQRRETTGSDDDEEDGHRRRSRDSDKQKPKKSIYSDDSDDEAAAPRRLEPQTGGGLTYVGKSKERHETRKEDRGGKEKEERKGAKRRPEPESTEEVEQKYDPKKVKREKLEFGIKKISDEERLEKLKLMFARKNDAKAIDEYRKRYFERRAAGKIVPVY